MGNSIICDRCREPFKFTPFVIQGKKLEIYIICPLCEQDLRSVVDHFIGMEGGAQEIRENIRKSGADKDL